MKRTSSATGLAWGLGTAAVAINVLGYMLLLHALPWFDEVVHAFTSFALTFIIACVIADAIRPERRILFLAILLACGIALGAVWEMGEWVYDALTNGNVIKGNQDTMSDLASDTVGALLAGLLALRLMGENPTT